MQFRQKLAKAIRVISAPPFAAAAFALILYFNPAGAIVRRDQLVACLLGLSVGPVLAYPISAALHTGREKQRVIAMYISLLSYGVLLAWSLLRPNSSEFRFVCMTYFMSVIMLIVFVIMMMVFMVMFMLMMVLIRGFLFFPEDGHLHVGAGNAALFGLFRLHPHARQPQRVHFVKKGLPVGDQLKQSRHQHISRGAHATFQIQGFHGLSSVPCL